MSRTSFMTWGILLILIGVQLNLVESFVLTPRATDFWNNRIIRNRFETVPGDYVATSNGYFRGASPAPDQLSYNSNNRARNNYQYSTPNYQRYRSSRVPVYQSSYGRPAISGRYYGPQKMLTLPSWFCWPPIFLGSVLFLYGVAGRE